MTARLSKTVVVGGVVYAAGSEVSDEVADKITAPGVIASRKADDKGSGSSGTSEGYGSLKVEDLEAEAAKRGLQVEGTGKDGKVLKADLVAALEADDKGSGS